MIESLAWPILVVLGLTGADPRGSRGPCDPGPLLSNWTLARSRSAPWASPPQRRAGSPQRANLRTRRVLRAEWLPLARHRERELHVRAQLMRAVAPYSRPSVAGTGSRAQYGPIHVASQLPARATHWAEPSPALDVTQQATFRGGAAPRRRRPRRARSRPSEHPRRDGWPAPGRPTEAGPGGC